MKEVHRVSERRSSSVRSTIFWGIFRVIMVTVLVTLLAFGVSLFLSIAGVLLAAMVKGGQFDMAVASRNIAFPIAVVCLGVTFVIALTLEIRNFRRTRA
jgi:hypothetical protein